MKIALIVPVINSDIVDEEIGMGIAANMLKQKGHEVLFTALHEHKENYEQILEFGPSLVGIITYSDTIAYVKSLSKVLKEMNNDTRIVLIGYAATHHYKELLTEPSLIDYAILGEFEESLCELTDMLHKSESNYENIKGLAYRNSTGVSVTARRNLLPQLDTLPYPDRSIMLQENLSYAKLQGSRGCQLNCCSFCCETGFWEKSTSPWRGRSPKNIVDEIELIIKQHNIYKINFSDNNYTDPDRSSDRVIEIADLLIKRGLPITYFVNIRSDFHHYISDDEMQYLIKSGYRGALLGFEAANQADLNLYGKAITVDDNMRAAEIFDKYNLGVDCGFININPYSSLENLQNNIDFLHKFEYMSYFTNLTKLKLFQGTSLFKKVQNDGLLKDSGEINIFDYEYYDPQIRKLVKFLNDYFYPMNESHHIMHRVRYFGVYFIQDTLNLLNYFEKVCTDITAVELLKECIANVNAELKRFNDVNYQWFNHLISFAENDISEDEIYSLSKHMMSLELILGYIEKLNHLKFAGYRNIIRHDKKYASIL